MSEYQARERKELTSVGQRLEYIEKWLLLMCIKQAISATPPNRILGLGLVATLVTDSMFHAPLFLVSEAAFFMLLLSVFMATPGSVPNPEPGDPAVDPSER